MTTRKEIFSWSLYDFANSAYSSLLPVLLFPLYYKAVILNNSSNADLWWGIAIGVSVTLSGILSPIVGAFSDITRKRKFSFILFSLITILGIFLLGFSGKLTPLLATALFVATNLSFGLAIGIYDSLLFNVSPEGKVGKVSGIGYGIGYAGAIICTLLVYPFLQLGVTSPYYKLSFIVVGFFYLFALPAFFFIKEKGFAHPEHSKNAIRETFKSIFKTIKDLRQQKHILLFLLAFYFLTEGLVTLTYFISLYSTTTLKISATQISLVFIVTQLVAIPATIIVGNFSDRSGYKRILIISSLILGLATILLVFAKSLIMVYVVGAIVGLVLGGSQATARAWFIKIIPTEKRSEFFGFNALASKISATIGPPLFGLISVLAKSQRIAMISILVYFALSAFFFYCLKPINNHQNFALNEQINSIKDNFK